MFGLKLDFIFTVFFYFVNYFFNIIIKIFNPFLCLQCNLFYNIPFIIKLSVSKQFFFFIDRKLKNTIWIYFNFYVNAKRLPRIAPPL